MNMKDGGNFLVAIGICLMGYAVLFMDVGVSAGVGQRIANSDLLSMRQTIAIVGAAFFVGGCVLLGSIKIVLQLQGELPAPARAASQKTLAERLRDRE